MKYKNIMFSLAESSLITNLVIWLYLETRKDKFMIFMTQNPHISSFDRYIYQHWTVGSVFKGLYILQLAVGHTVYVGQDKHK